MQLKNLSPERSKFGLGCNREAHVVFLTRRSWKQDVVIRKQLAIGTQESLHRRRSGLFRTDMEIEFGHGYPLMSASPARLADPCGSTRAKSSWRNSENHDSSFRSHTR